MAENRYHTEPDYWYDYGRWHLRMEDKNAALECFSHALSIDPHHVNSLVGVTCVLLESKVMSNAALFLKALREALGPSRRHDANYLVIEALFYEEDEQKLRSASVFSKAEGLSKSSKARNFVSVLDPTILPAFVSHASPLVKLGHHLTNLSCYRLAERLLNQDLQTLRHDVPSRKIHTPTPVTPSTFTARSSISNKQLVVPSPRHATGRKTADGPVMSARVVIDDPKITPPDDNALIPTLVALGYLYMKRRMHAEAESVLKRALSAGLDEGQVVEALGLLGHVHYQSGRTDEALESYESYLGWEPPKPDRLVLWRLCLLHGAKGQARQMRRTALALSDLEPCATSWLTCGKASLQLGDEKEAEVAFIQANRYNNRNPVVWGYLAIVCLRTGRMAEAKQCLDLAMRLQLSDEDVHEQAATIFMTAGMMRDAESVLLHGLRRLPDSAKLKALHREALASMNLLLEW